MVLHADNSDKDPDTGPENRDPAGAEPEPDSKEIPEHQEIDFVTLGMFIIDEIEFPPPRTPVRDILGGAGSYSALGARLFSPPPSSRSVAWIIDQGSDFPPSITTQINTWQTSALFRHDPSRLTTRGWNGYGTATNPSSTTTTSSSSSSDQRAFRYTTPKRRLTADDLTPPLLQAKAVHLICSPRRCQELVADILARRKAAYYAHPPAHDPQGEAYSRPLIVWEPVPDLCLPTELLNCTNTLPLVDVCSPNHAELAGFMGSGGGGGGGGSGSTADGGEAAGEGEGGGGGGEDDDAAIKADVERHCEQLLASMPLQSYTLVVRAGKRGCFVARNGGRKKKADAGVGGSSSGSQPQQPERKKKRKEYVRGGLRPDTDMEALFAGLMQDDEGRVAREEIEIDPGVEKWVPAYYGKGYKGEGRKGDEDGESKVVDPTGGGNTFLGAMAVALARGQSIEEACAWGHVAASFAIEQVGFPVLSVDEEGRETWNGVRVEDRLREFQGRL